MEPSPPRRVIRAILGGDDVLIEIMDPKPWLEGLDPAPTDPPNPAAGAGSKDGKLFIWNLVALVIVGVAVSAWLIRFTDWFETAASLFALGGVLTWSATVLRLLPEERLKALQKTLTATVLDRHGTWQVCAALLILLGLASFCVGSVQIQGGTGASDSRVQIYRVGAPHSERDSLYLPANGHVRALFVVRPFRQADVRVKVSNLPEGEITVDAIGWMWSKPVRRVVPLDFLQPVVLIAAESSLTNQAASNREARDASQQPPSDSTWLVVWLKGKKYRTPFDGHSIWIGCRTDDVMVPEKLRLDWSKDLTDPNSAPLMLSPRHGSAEDWPPKVPDEGAISAYLVRIEDGKANRISGVNSLHLRAPAAIADVVQYSLLKAKGPSDPETTDDKVEDFPNGGVVPSADAPGTGVGS
jgi:hypothetical protein